MAALIGVSGIAGTFVLAGQEQRTVDAAVARTFVSSAGNVPDQMRLHLSRYEDLLSSLRVRHRPPEPTRFRNDITHALIEGLTERRYAGYQAVVIARRRRGAPALSAQRAYVEPHRMSAAGLGFTDRNASALNEALRAATDTAGVATTAPLPLTADPTGPMNLVMWAPLYRVGAPQATTLERRAALEGWVGVVFRGDQFFNEALVRTTDGIRTEVFFGSPDPENLIAVRPLNLQRRPGQERVASLAASGRVWTLRMQPLPLPGLNNTNRNVVIVAGVLITPLLAGFIGLLGGAKNRALRLVAQKTGDLRRSEQRFRSLASASPLGVFGLSADGHCEYANEQLCLLTGRSREELRGSGLSAAYHVDDRVALRKAVTGADDRASALRLRLVLPDGSLRWVKTHAAPLRDERDVLTGWVGSVEDVTAEVQAQVAAQELASELAHQARHDDLTGLPNRTQFIEQVTELLNAPSAQGLAVLFFDVDRFKVVNDSLGHTAGDRLLVTFADRLQQAIRPGDLAARFGGDEFVVALLDVDSRDVAAAEAQRLIAALNRTMCVDGHEVMVSVSIGVTLSQPGLDAEALLTQADSAMYQAKARGKARYEVFEPAAPTAARDSALNLELQLRHAINGNELRLFYQPIMSLRSGAVEGVEALVRWQHPERGLLAPGSFIPAAEDSGLAVPLGAWVLREACTQLKRWQPLIADRPDFSMSVNVSTRQLADPAFPAVVADVLRKYDVDPRLICLEITETALLQDLETADEALRQLRELGVRIAVDDFGTGYSSLTHLRVLPIDVIKIDRSFVNDLGVDADNTAIVSAVIRLANALGLTSVAEGVEAREQLNRLTSMGCDLAQGYFIATPEPAEAVTPLLSRGLRAAPAAALSPTAG